MEHAVATNRSHPARQPLRDASNRANLHHPPPRRPRQVPLTLSLDKLNKLVAEGRGVENPDSPATPVENKRISAVIDSQQNSNRNSAISTCSTASTKSRRKTHIGPWQLGRTLGKGSTGRVRLAKHAISGQSAAIKIVSKKSAAMAQSQSIAAIDRSLYPSSTSGTNKAIPSGIEREVVIMKLIQHPNVISLYDVWENRGELYLVLEYVEGGELFDYVSSEGPLHELEAVRLFRQIIAGLSYCHQFNICHRDLKPENILLDGRRNIKLADFGMAALQPAGHWLNTSCGSPHYASPEIVNGRRYQGDKADIWSCGIILFAMLAGFLPFDGGDLTNTLRLVKRGEYILPPWFSPEAVDMIQRILQKRPEDRITMQEMWLHPLFRKYENHPFLADELVVAPPPSMTPKDCGRLVSRRQDIDLEILRSLQTLWHGSKPEELIGKLMNDEANHEKLFYRALQKFRDDQLENYDGQALGYSSSDYHHTAALHSNRKRQSIIPGEPCSWQRSKGSLTPDTPTPAYRDNIYKARSARNNSSYDPFRSSHSPMPNPQAEFANVTIHRDSSRTISPSPIPSSVVSKSRTTDQSSINLDSSMNPIVPRNSGKNSMASFQSHSSMGSTRHRGKPFIPKVASYKRNVSFRHLQNPGAATPMHKNKLTQAQSQYSICTNSSVLVQRDGHGGLLPSDRFSTPSLPTPTPLVRKRREPAKGTNVDTKKARLSFREDARKVSQELSKICEEAFNQPPNGSTVQAPVKELPRTPIVATTGPQDLIEPQEERVRQPSIGETLGSSRSYATKELAETRRRLMEHSTRAGADGLPDYLTDVISHLDRLIDGDPPLPRGKADILNKPTFVAARAVSGRLPSISEENHNNEDSGVAHEATNPLTETPSWQGGKTIRVVPDPANPNVEIIKPLTIRKKRKPLPQSTEQEVTDFFSLQEPLEVVHGPNTCLPSSRRSSLSKFNFGLDSIEEDPKSARTSDLRSSGETRKWGWFKSRPRSFNEPPPSPVDEEKKSRYYPSGFTMKTEREDQQEPAREAAEDDSQRFKRLLSTSKGDRILKLFGKKKKPEKRVHELARGINDPDDSLDEEEVGSITDRPDVETGNSSPELGPLESKNGIGMPFQLGGTSNWFSKFLHIKPAVKILALHLPKGRARKEVVKILREWKKYGLEDVRVDKQTGTAHGTVGPLNFLRLRPVEFSAEFFTVLEHGRHASLSLIRLRQERGAASSFHKLAETLTIALKGRKYLIQDPVKVKRMAKVLNV